MPCSTLTGIFVVGGEGDEMYRMSFAHASNRVPHEDESCRKGLRADGVKPLKLEMDQRLFVL
jgi:hypothetical protein